MASPWHMFSRSATPAGRRSTGSRSPDQAGLPTQDELDWKMPAFYRQGRHLGRIEGQLVQRECWRMKERVSHAQGALLAGPVPTSALGI